MIKKKNKKDTKIQSLMKALADANTRGISDVSVMIGDNEYDLDYTSVSELTGCIIHLKPLK